MSAKFHDYIVPGLDVLIGDPSILSPSKTDKQRAKVFEIPESYIYGVIDFYHEQTARGDSSRELTSRFNTILTAMHEQNTDSFELDNGTLVKFVSMEECIYPEGLNRHSSKSQTIAVTKKLFRQKDIDYHNIAIMTGTDQLSAIAARHKIDVARINPNVYTGRRKVVLPIECANLWYLNKEITPTEWRDVFPDEAQLRPNEFVEFDVENYGQSYRGFSNIGRFDVEKNALIPLQHTKFDNPSFSAIRPRTPGQAMLLEALLLPVDKVPIVIVPGTFGTGKTFLSTAAGYYGVTESGEYERVFVCPHDGSLGKDIGAIPGDSTEKTMVKAKPIADNLRNILRLITPPGKSNNQVQNFKNAAAKRSCLDKKVQEILDQYFEFESLIYMNGRNVSNSLIIYDEFQNMERYQARQLVGRVGDDSKMVISGDPTQLSNPHMNQTSNGLSYIASKLAGKPEATIVTLYKEETTRSTAAKAIAKYLEG